MKKKLPNIHPGEVLREEFMKPMHLSANGLAKNLDIPVTRITEILHERRAVTVDTALRFAKFFGTTPQFWIGLQMDFEMEEIQRNIKTSLSKIIPYNQKSNQLKEDRTILEG